MPERRPQLQLEALWCLTNFPEHAKVRGRLGPIYCECHIVNWALGEEYVWMEVNSSRRVVLKLYIA